VRLNVAPLSPPGVRTVAERPGGSGVHVHPDWYESFPWLIQGVTGSDADMSLFGGTSTGEVIPRWQDLRERLGCRSMVHAHQVHRAAILLHDRLPEGLIIAPSADGHVTREAGTLLAVSVADCVPIFIAAPSARAVALLHGGWRGVAAGILEQGIRLLTATFPVDAGDLHVHFGPAICGQCFEVGTEVPEGLGMEERQGVTHVDLRALLAHRAIAAGVHAASISISAHCTRHGESPFYSHRGGCAERQIGVLGVRPDHEQNAAPSDSPA
jgi:polyphenol oxidase